MDNAYQDEEFERKFYVDEEAADESELLPPPSLLKHQNQTRRGGDLSRDQDEWETALLVRSGAAVSKANSNLELASSRRVLVRAVKPAFQAGTKGSFFSSKSATLVDVVRDRSSDMAKVAEKGSLVLKQWKEKTSKSKMRQKYWELGGSDMGKTIGFRGEAQYIGEEEHETLNASSDAEAGKPDAESLVVNQSLPVDKVLPDLIRAVRENQIVIVVGETGSGKTTRLPISFQRDGSFPGIIACTQPRRVAAMSVAKRVAEECGVPVGGLVGYSIRFEDCTSVETKVKYMTDGVLLRESLHDRELDRYSLIVMDEAHERSVNTDVLFGITKRIVRNRRDFRLVITSATLDADKFSSFFGGCAVFHIPGRTFRVESYFAKTPMMDYVDAAVKQILQIHLTLPPGDILVFMTGQDDITCTCELAAERLGNVLLMRSNDEIGELEQKKKLAKSKLLLLPMYSTLPQDVQKRIFQPALPGQRKCVVSTNIAETSLTVEGIRYVVDCGFIKTKVFNSKIGMDTLRLVPISQAAANQRKGRAGRTQEGYCYRLYTDIQFSEELLPSAVPEIQRTNLGAVILELKSLGFEDPTQDFQFMDPPPLDNLLDSMNQLWVLGAIDGSGKLTDLGRRMVEFPLDPALSKMLIYSNDNHCSSEIVTIVSMLSVPDVFFRPPGREEEADQVKERFIVPESDHLTLVNVHNQFMNNDKNPGWCAKHFIHFKAMNRALEVRDQLTDVMRKNGIREQAASSMNWDVVRKCICSSYFANSATLKGVGQYVNLLNGIPCFLHPSSGLAGLGYTPDYVVYHELVITTKEWMRCVTSVEAEWLSELGPVFFCLEGEEASLVPTDNLQSQPLESNPHEVPEHQTRQSTRSSGGSSIQAARDRRNKRSKGLGWVQ